MSVSSPSSTSGSAAAHSRRPSFLRPRLDYPVPLRRPRWIGWVLTLLAATVATFTVWLALLVDHSPASSLRTWVLVGFFVSVMAVTKLFHLRERKRIDTFDPFDSASRPKATTFVAEVCDRYGLRVEVRESSSLSTSALTMVAGFTPVVVINPRYVDFASQDSSHLRRVLAHELTHVIRDHPMVRPALYQLVQTLPVTLLLAVAALWGGFSGIAAYLLASAGILLTTWINLYAARPPLLRRLLRPIHRFCEHEAERGSVGLAGADTTLLASIHSAACSFNQVDGPFESVSPAYFSDARLLFEATGDEQWLDPGSDAWAHTRAKLFPAIEEQFQLGPVEVP